jgi:hypothetical protein
MDASGAHSPLVLAGQASFFLAFGIRTLLMAKTPWVLAEHGILGPSAFIPWQHASAFEWLDADTVAIRTRPEVCGTRQLRIPVAERARQRVDETLAGKLPGRSYQSTGAK